MLGHSGWMLVELLFLLASGMCVLVLAIVALRGRWLLAPHALVLLVLQLLASIDAGNAHSAFLWGGQTLEAILVRPLAWSAPLPLLIDLVVGVLVGSWWGAGDSRIRERILLVARRSGYFAPARILALRGGVDLSLALGGLLLLGPFEEPGTGLPNPGEATWALASILVALLLLSGATLVLFVRETSSFWREPGALAFKRAFDRFPGALAVGAPDRSPIMMNEGMRRLLARRGIGTTLDMRGIWRRLESGEGEAPGLIEELSRSGSPGEEETTARADRSRTGTILVRSGERSWLFGKSEREYGPRAMRAQIWGEDVSARADLLVTLARENESLRASMREVEASIREVVRLVEEQDVVGARLRLHDVLAQRLVFVRRFLEEGVGERLRLEALASMLVTLGEDLHEPDGGGPAGRLGMIASGCALMGVECRIVGVVPADARVADAFLSALGQAVTNAVLHADARRIEVVFGEDAESWTMSATNPLAEPVAVVERAGIAGMRSRIAALGGDLEVESGEDFVVRARVPKSGSADPR